jgi:hypothetical protein
MQSFLPYMFRSLAVIITRQTRIMKEMLYINCYYKIFEGTSDMFEH